MSDNISRQAALKVVCGSCVYGWCPDDDKCEEYEAMKNLPSADPKTGKWIKAVDDGVWSFADVYAQCDQCHKVTFNGWNMNFCPNCGADMRGEK